MNKIRNLVAIIILCIIGVGVVRKSAPPIALVHMTHAPTRDTEPLPKHRLSLPKSSDDQLKDQSAESPAAPRGMSSTPMQPSPRGQTDGGFNPNGRLDLPKRAPKAPPISPSAPSQEL